MKPLKSSNQSKGKQARTELDPWSSGTESLLGFTVPTTSPLERIGGSLIIPAAKASAFGVEELTGIAGFERKGKEVLHRFNDVWIMVGIVGGEGTVVSCGRVLVAKPGSVYIIPPGISFREKNNGGESWHFACLKVKLSRHVTEWEMPNNAPTFLDRDFAVVARISEIIKALHYRGPGFELKAFGGALMLFGHLKERGGQKTSPDDSSDMAAKAIEVIRENLKTPISLSCLAKLCNVSESCLSHQFKKEMGLSPMQYTRRERVKAAKELILTGTDVYEASERLGFKTQFHLSKIFKAVEGKPPIFFRKLARYKQSL